MSVTNSDLLIQLRQLIKQLGNDGGLVSPSVYDTAQLLRLCPPKEGVGRGIEWLLSQQNSDGGWGTPTVPATRDVPTLAAILTLYTYRQEFAVDDVIQAGVAFLKRQAHQWMSIHIDLVPIAGEMIIPYLLEEAEQMGLEIDQAPYARIFELRCIKLTYLDGQSLPPNSSPTFSWEALGFPYKREVLHARTGVGHSPAATVSWLHTIQRLDDDGDPCSQALDYLARAAEATGTGIPGVVPMVYPITGFELCYGLFGLLLTGLLDHPALQDVVAPKLAELQAMMEREQGLSFGEHFVADVDGTAVAVAVLQAANRPVNLDLVRRFWRNDHFYTYLHELNASVFSNAHALHALVLGDERSLATENFLIQRQSPNGAWMVDKWHTSWRSATLEVVAALLPLGYEEQLDRAARALIDDQNPDGSWGAPDGAPVMETTYSIIALQLLASTLQFADVIQATLGRGHQWLKEHIDHLNDVECTWLGKETYSAIRVDKVYRLCAILSPLLHQTHPMVARTVVSPI